MLPQSKAKKKTMPYKWARQGKVQLKIKMSIVQFSTNHSLQSLAMNIRLDDEIDLLLLSQIFFYSLNVS